MLDIQKWKKEKEAKFRFLIQKDKIFNLEKHKAL